MIPFEDIEIISSGAETLREEQEEEIRIKEAVLNARLRKQFEKKEQEIGETKTAQEVIDEV